MITRTRTHNCRHLPALWLAAGVVAFSVSTAFATTTPDPVKASLVSAVDSVRLGQPVAVGVFLKVEKGWHVYWQFAGDAGLPPEIHWQLPEGWSAGDIRWPIPRKFTEAGPLTTYGYEDSVLLMTEITPPASITGISRVALSARVNWLVCHSECIPGKATVTLSLPVGKGNSDSKTIAKNKPRFRHWQSLLPDTDGIVSILSGVTAAKKDDSSKTARVKFRIRLPSQQGEKLVDWFPSPTSNLAVTEMAQTAGPTETEITFLLKSYKGPIVDGLPFESLLVYQDSSGRKRGVRLITPIKPS